MSEPLSPIRYTLKLKLFADYFQFILEDELAAEMAIETTDWPPDGWWEQLLMYMLAVAPGRIWVSTVRNMTVPVRVDLVDTSPPNDFAAWDHVAEASIEVPSGRVVIKGIESLAKANRLPVQPSTYRVRVYYGGLESISKNGLEGNDHYALILWPAEYSPPALLKKWPLWPPRLSESH